MPTSTASRTAEYKSRKYRLLYCGPTKYGRRAHLQFFDGTKDFWVDASLVTEVSDGGSYRAPDRYEHRCRNGHAPHQGPCCTGRHRGGDDCGCDCCEMD